MKNIFFFIIILFFIDAKAKLSFSKAQFLSQIIINEFQNELQKNNLQINIHFSSLLKLPSASAKWKEKNKIGQITFHYDFLNLKSVDEVSFALNTCHELGHFLGGAPFIASSKSAGIIRSTSQFSGMSAEGQADFFATSVCLPKIISKLSFPLVPAKRSWKNYCHQKSKNCLKTLYAIDKTMQVYREIFIISAKQFEVTDLFLPKTNILLSTNFKTLRTLDRRGEYPSMLCRSKIMLNGFFHSESNQTKPLRLGCWYK